LLRVEPDDLHAIELHRRMHKTLEFGMADEAASIRPEIPGQVIPARTARRSR
jgi:hypothetical protein